MNNIWSEHVQGVMTLYLSRKLRFDDHFFEQYNFDENVSIRYSVKGVLIDPYNNPDYHFLTKNSFGLCHKLL